MITITESAAAQIRQAAERIDGTNLFLRLAAKIEDDGKFEYGMGFDQRRDNDTLWQSAGVSVLVAASCADLLAGATLDYVELNPGEFRFIFINPNDPAHAGSPRRPS